MSTQSPVHLFDLTCQNVVIPGGAGVLARGIANALVLGGANVAIMDRDPVRGKQLVQRIEHVEGACGRAIHVYADVLNRDSLIEASKTVEREFGQVHALINAAGGNKPPATTGKDLSFFDLPEDALRFVFDLNMLGTVLPCQVFGKGMAERGEGVIVNLSSMSAFRPLTRIPAYAAAKAGVSNFTQWLAVYMAQEYSPKIRVNAIAPGFFLTEQNRFLLTDKNTGELTARGKAIIAHTPMKRFGVPEDLIGTVMWLLSPASSFVSGIVVPVDGAFSAYSGV